MKVALFIPCYIDQLYPRVAVATLELLEKLGCEVEFPTEQTCCGQPLANSGFARWAGACTGNFQKNFEGFEFVVAPSGSCVEHIREHVPMGQTQVLELCEFLTDVLKIKALKACFPHRVGYHVSCHGQRLLGLSSMSERVGEPFSKPLSLLQMVEGIEVVTLERPDECCGFGGTFCVTEEAVSVKMGRDRLADHLAQGVTHLVGGDVSCLMHLEGILRRQGQSVEVLHIAEVLNQTV
jgi:L-lactate dehydrogenase complex protein LldE